MRVAIADGKMSRKSRNVEKVRRTEMKANAITLPRSVYSKGRGKYESRGKLHN